MFLHVTLCPTSDVSQNICLIKNVVGLAGCTAKAQHHAPGKTQFQRILDVRDVCRSVPGIT